MQRRTFIKRAHELVDSHGGEQFLAVAVDELGIEYVEDVPAALFAFVLARAQALYEELTQ